GGKAESIEVVGLGSTSGDAEHIGVAAKGDSVGSRVVGRAVRCLHASGLDDARGAGEVDLVVQRPQREVSTGAGQVGSASAASAQVVEALSACRRSLAGSGLVL